MMGIGMFWIDCWWQEKSFGFGFLTFKFENLTRSFFSIYWLDGELLVDLFWLRVLTTCPSVWFIRRNNG